MHFFHIINIRKNIYFKNVRSKHLQMMGPSFVRLLTLSNQTNILNFYSFQKFRVIYLHFILILLFFFFFSFLSSTKSSGMETKLEASKRWIFNKCPRRKIANTGMSGKWSSQTNYQLDKRWTRRKKYLKFKGQLSIHFALNEKWLFWLAATRRCHGSDFGRTNWFFFLSIDLPSPE